jgi:hypothetical protein
MDDEKIYLTPEDVCRLVPGISKDHLAQRRFRGLEPRFLKPTPRTVLYRRADVIQWVENSEHIRTDQPTRNN